MHGSRRLRSGKGRAACPVSRDAPFLAPLIPDRGRPQPGAASLHGLSWTAPQTAVRQLRTAITACENARVGRGGWLIKRGVGGAEILRPRFLGFFSADAGPERHRPREWCHRSHDMRIAPID